MILARRPGAAERIESEIQQTIALITKTCPNAKLPELKPTTKQRELVRACMEARVAAFLAKADTRTQALLRGLQQSHAGRWKSAAHTPEMFFPADQFMAIARFQIAQPMPEVMHQVTCPCCKKVPLDPYGDHALICMNTGDVSNRHNSLYKVLVAEARAGMISLTVESALAISSTQTYSADFIVARGIPGFRDGPTAIDLTITHTLNPSTVVRAANEDLIAADLAGRRKDKEIKANVEKLNYHFLPLPFETTGGHSEEVATLVHYIANQKSLMTGIPFGEVANRIWELLSVTLQQANAFALNKRYFELITPEDELP